MSLQVQPGARRSEIAGEHGGALKIRVAAPPVEGKANAALVRWLATLLEVPIRSVAVVSGAASRAKRVRIDCDLSADAMLVRFGVPPD